ncbi:MAG: zf-HC2 domain-containing protein [Candidatus Aminicenantes bacterium]|nr:MAG: zf-HC2 domain-containing protein [Candidatus Aminicenantes bacterium]
MNCLRIDQVYLFLEGELSPKENRSIEGHISSCEKCHKAVEERKLLVEASQSLPVWEIPQGFTQNVLAQIFQKRIALRDWIITASIGLSSAVLAFFVVHLLSGQNLADLFINLNRTVLSLFQNIVVVLFKAVKLISVGIQVILKIVSLIIKGFASITTILSLELQIGLIVLTIVFTALLLFGAKRKLLAGEKA